jgi:hypothetical protein
MREGVHRGLKLSWCCSRVENAERPFLEHRHTKQTKFAEFRVIVVGNPQQLALQQQKRKNDERFVCIRLLEVEKRWRLGKHRAWWDDLEPASAATP